MDKIYMTLTPENCKQCVFFDEEDEFCTVGSNVLNPISTMCPLRSVWEYQQDTNCEGEISKFRLYQKVWCLYKYHIYSIGNSTLDCVGKYAIGSFTVEGISRKEDKISYILHNSDYKDRVNGGYCPIYRGRKLTAMSGSDIRVVEDYEIFSTQEEAEAKLKEYQS